MRWANVGLVWVLLQLVVAPAGTARAQAPESQTVQLRILMPAADARLSVEDVPTRQSGIIRQFISPPLETGKKYVYTLKAVWAPNNYTTITRVRQFTVRAGPEVTMDLRNADDKSPDKIVIRYVPTPPEVVEAMLKLAGVGKDDVVYDLGCGDGRIVIAAVEKFHAKHGVGVDLDPRRISESKENARAHGVEGRVEFRQADVLQIKDLSAASVVTLYMGDELDEALRPILQKQLKPGSRIVSHRFLMGNWKPLETQTITDRTGEKYLIHLWKIGETKP
jgi:uncharacterized protein (TIGR03000 family)